MRGATEPLWYVGLCVSVQRQRLKFKYQQMTAFLSDVRDAEMDSNKQSNVVAYMTELTKMTSTTRMTKTELGGNMAVACRRSGVNEALTPEHSLGIYMKVGTQEKS